MIDWGCFPGHSAVFSRSPNFIFWHVSVLRVMSACASWPGLVNVLWLTCCAITATSAKIGWCRLSRTWPRRPKLAGRLWRQRPGHVRNRAKQAQSDAPRRRLPASNRHGAVLSESSQTDDDVLTTSNDSIRGFPDRLFWPEREGISCTPLSLGFSVSPRLRLSVSACLSHHGRASHSDGTCHSSAVQPYHWIAMTLNDNRDDDLTQRRWCSHASAERRPDEYDLWDDGARGCGAYLGHLFLEQVSPLVVCDGVPCGRNDSEVAGLGESRWVASVEPTSNR